MSREVAAFVLGQIEKKAKLPDGVPLEEFDYLESGHLDSIGIIRFVIDLERQFDIALGEADIESTEFRTVGGLISLIERKRTAKDG